MVTTLIRPPAYVHTVAPRGALWAADLGAAVYRFLERIGANRARRSLRVAADQWQATDPQRADVMRSAEAHLKRQLEASAGSAMRGASPAASGDRSSSALF